MVPSENHLEVRKSQAVHVKIQLNYLQKFLCPFIYSFFQDVSHDILFHSNKRGDIRCMVEVCFLMDRVVGSRMHIQIGF